MINNIKFILGDALTELKKMETESVQSCITSPPYFGLRDYGTAKWEGGNPECDHKGKPMATKAGFNERYFGKPSVVDKQGECLEFYKSVCGKCGAKRVDEQIGLETSVEEYVSKLVEIFREIKRILKPDGTLWLNLGDSYAGGSGCHKGGSKKQSSNVGATNSYIPSKVGNGLKPKDLIGVPWMMAFALREDGWYLRSDIVWSKPNAMPESVSDRPTKSHEYLFLLTKNKKYYYDNESIKEPSITFKTDKRTSGQLSQRISNRNKETSPHKNLQEDGQQPNSFHVNRANGGKDTLYEKKNKRDVWSVSTKGYKEAHFAVFPEKLIEPCVLAGSKCGDLVLDPFNGSGTTALVCAKHNRSYVGIDINPIYIELSKNRLIKEGFYNEN